MIPSCKTVSNGRIAGIADFPAGGAEHGVVAGDGGICMIYDCGETAVARIAYRCSALAGVAIVTTPDVQDAPKA
jgi:hypothetical protein